MTLFQAGDLRQAWRGLRRTPATTACAIACLALGLGITSAVSSAIDHALLRPPPFRDPARLVQVYRTAPQADSWPMSAPNYQDLARGTTELSAMAAITYKTALVSLPDQALQAAALRVTGNFFPMLGVGAERGRMLNAQDDAPGQPAVAVLSDEFWRQSFGADPAVVGRVVQIDGQPVTIVGVAPRGLQIPRGAQMISGQLWLPMHFTPQELSQRGSNFIMVMGRLAPHATVASVGTQIGRVFDALEAQYPGLKGEGVRIVPMESEAIHAVQTPLLLVFGAVWMVLLIAATDVAALLLARGVQRRREMAVRLAIGASRWEVMRPVLIESVLLGAIGVVLGIALAWVGVRTIGALAAQRLPQLAGLTIDLRVVAFAVVLAAVVAVCCGAYPAWRSASIDPQDALRSGRGGGMTRGHHRALRTLVITEVALSMVLLLGAGLVLKGFMHLASSDPGFDPAPILTVKTTVSPQAYPDNTAIRRFLGPAIEAVNALPGVAAAGSIQLLPYQNWGWNFNIRYEGQPGDETTKLPLVEVRVVTPGFFDVTGQHLIRGRLLQPSDDDRPGVQQVVVVNEALARRDFPNGDVIGKRFYVGDSLATIVGEVSNIRNVGPYRPPAAAIYQTYLQAGGFTAFPLMIRVRHGDPEAVARAVTTAIRRVDPQAAVTDVLPMTEIMASSIGQPRFYLTLLTTFAAVAGVLALAGLYGVMSYVVAQGTREIGIRSALGSGTASILRMVTAQGMGMVGIGLAIGLAASVATTRLLTGLLYGVSPLDPVSWIAAAALLVTAALLAALIPAFRATRVDPVTAMRVE